MLGSKIEATTPNVGFLLSSVGYSMLFLCTRGKKSMKFVDVLNVVCYGLKVSFSPASL